MSAPSGTTWRTRAVTLVMVLALGGIASARAQQQDEGHSRGQSPIASEESASSASHPADPGAASDSDAARHAPAQSDSSMHEHYAHAKDHSADDPEPSDHIAPPPPQHAMEGMGAREMTRIMEMDDSQALTMLKLDRLERDFGDDSASAWKLSAWFGGDFEKLLLRSEGEHARGEFEHADAEILWDHAVASFWDTQLGVRHDFGVGPDRNWAAFGVQGLAPYWFNVEATAYVGDAGRTALRVEVDYDLSLTQRLILQPRVELNAYGKTDPAARIGSGLSDAEIGLRLRYEIRREIAPYIGIERVRRFGTTASFAEDDGMNVGDTRWVVGVRVWY